MVSEHLIPVSSLEWSKEGETMNWWQVVGHPVCKGSEGYPVGSEPTEELLSTSQNFLKMATGGMCHNALLLRMGLHSRRLLR